MSASRRLRKALGNHVPKVMALVREQNLPAGRVSEVQVAHDGWCRIFEGKPCNCNPTARLVTVHPAPDQYTLN